MKNYYQVQNQLSEIYNSGLGWNYRKSSFMAMGMMRKYIRTLIGSGDYIQSYREKANTIEEPPMKFRKLLLDNGQTEEIIDMLQSELDLDLEAKSRNKKIEYENAIFYTLTERGRGLEELLEIGMDVNSVNWYGKTPLMTAAHLNNLGAVRVLLKAGAEVNAKTTQDNSAFSRINYSSRTALMYAMENGSYYLIEALIKAGADINSIDSGGRSIADYLSLNEKMSDNDKDKVNDLLQQYQ